MSLFGPVSILVLNTRHSSGGITKLVSSHAVRRVGEDNIELGIRLGFHPGKGVGVVALEAG